MKKLSVLLLCFSVSFIYAQTCNKLNHNCSNTVGLNTTGVTSNGGSTYACTLGDNVLYSSSSSDPYIATDDIIIDQGMAATLHFDARRASGYFGTCEVWVHIGGYCNFYVYDVPFDDNGWVQIGTFSPNTSCSQFGPFTVPSDVVGGQMLSYCIVLKGASSTNFVSIDNICVSQIAGSGVPTTMNEDFGTSSSGWYPNAGVDDIPYHTYKNASSAYTILGSGAGSFPDKAAYFYTGFDFCSSVSGVGIITKEINTSAYTNGEIRLQFKSKYPCSGANSYTFDENYQSYSPEIFVMQGPDNGANSWTQLPVNYYFSDYNWRVASYDISAYKNANVKFKIERGGFCGTSMEAVDNIKILDRDCSISLLSCGTITGETAPLQNTQYPYTVPAVTGATYYKWYVRHEGNLYDTAPYIVSGQGTQNVTIDFQTLPASGVRVLCIPFDTDPGVDTDACYAEIGILGVTVGVSNPIVVDNVITTNPLCSGTCDGSIDIDVSGGVPPYSYSWSPNVSTTDIATNLCDGAYQITITDSNLDFIVEDVILTEPTPLTVTCDPGSSICAGDTIQLNGPTPSGGTAPYSFEWSPNTDISDQFAQNPLVWPGSSTTYTVTVTDANGCIAMCGIPITVNPVPVPDFTTSQTSGCGPLVVNFYNSGTSGISCDYQFGDGGNLSDCDSVQWTYFVAGQYTVTYTVTDINGCSGVQTYVNLITVFETPLVDPIGDVSACDTDNLTGFAFTGTPAGNSYAWTNLTGIDLGFGLSGTGDIGPFVATNFSGSSDTITIEVVPTSTDGCVGAAEIFQFIVNPRPPLYLGADITSCDAFVTLDAGAGMDDYLWSNTQTTQTIDATSSGTYWVTVTLAGCSSTDSIDVTLLDCTGIIELGNSEIRLFPNPTDSEITLSGLPDESAIQVFDLKGAEVYFGVFATGTAVIDLSDLKSGTYMLQVTSANQSETIRIIKQ